MPPTDRRRGWSYAGRTLLVWLADGWLTVAVPLSPRVPDGAIPLKEEAMPAYLLATVKSVKDRRGMEEYCHAPGLRSESSGAKHLAAYTPFKLLEGKGPVEGIWTCFGLVERHCFSRLPTFRTGLDL